MDLNEERIDKTERFTSIAFEITNICNKYCKYCIRMYGKNERAKHEKIKHMKIKDYKHVISCMNKKDREKFRSIIISGGEPILHPKFIELIKLMRIDFPKAKIGVQSNGKTLRKLPQKNLRILPNIKNIIFNVSHYPEWNDDIRKLYDNHYKPPNIWVKLVNKLTINKLFSYINLDYRFPIITNKIRRFLIDPLKRGNVYFGEYIGFRDPYDDPKLSKETAKTVRSICYNYIYIIGRKLYNCCHSQIYERYYDTDPVGTEFDENWKKNYFKLPTWKACVHCRMGTYRYRFIKIESKLGYKKYKGISLKTRMKITNIKEHE